LIPARIAVDGLPLDREERLSVVMRLCDTLGAVRHADDLEREGSGVLWQRYAKGSYVHGWLLDEDEPP
jgi:hypothetical protein